MTQYTVISRHMPSYARHMRVYPFWSRYSEFQMFNLNTSFQFMRPHRQWPWQHSDLSGAPTFGHFDSCQVLHRTSTYDVVRNTYNIVRQTYVVVLNIVRTISYDITYDIEYTPLYLCQYRRCNVRHRRLDVPYRTFHKLHVVTMSYVPKNLRHRRFVNSCRIRCCRCSSYTMS